jgi:hypothetical protein
MALAAVALASGEAMRSLAQPQQAENPQDRPSAWIWITSPAPSPAPAQNQMTRSDSHPGDYDRYFKTLCYFIKSRRVLNRAISHTGVDSLPAIKRRKDPVSWLQRILETNRLGDSELMSVQIVGGSGLSGKDQATIINRVCDALLEETMKEDRDRLEIRSEMLTKSHHQYLLALRSRREKLRALLQDGADDPQSRTLKQQLEMESLASLRRELTEVQSQKRKIEAMLKTQHPAENEEAAARQQLKTQTEMEQRLKDELESLARSAQRRSAASLDVQEMQEEIRAHEDLAKRITEELESSRLALDGSLRLRLIDRAEAPAP